jgi:thiol-disulfide isomerase/thioredoxin
MQAASFQESMRRELSIVFPGLVDTFVHRGARAAVISRGMPSEPARRSASGALLLLGCALVASSCSREVGPATEAPALRPEPPRTPAEAPHAVPSPTPLTSAAPVASAAPAEPPPRPFVLVELGPTQGDLQPLLREHAEKARARGLKPFVEFYADWCRPCKLLASLMNDPFIVEAFTGTYVLKLNFDDWQDKLAEAGFQPREIPMFYALDARGQPTGRKLSGDAWGKANAESMSKVLGPFFRR